MFCPQCRCQYVEGIATCSDCQVPLVDELPPEPLESEVHPDVQLRTVLQPRDELELSLACSMLDEATIPYVVKNRGVQDLFGMGRWGGFNYVTGPMALQVDEHDEASAKELLASLETERGPGD